MATQTLAPRNDQLAEDIGRQIAKTPRLRSRFLEDPFTTVVDSVESAVRAETVAQPEEAAEFNQEVLQAAAAELSKGEAASFVHSSGVQEQFFARAIENPERSFRAILWLSVATFAVSVAVIAGGLALAFVESDVRSIVVASIFGAAGIIGSIGAIFGVSRSGISTANANHAQLRVILADFSTELGHLRAIPISSIDDVERVNSEIRRSMSRAVEMIQTMVKVDPMSARNGAPAAAAAEEASASNGTRAGG